MQQKRNGCIGNIKYNIKENKWILTKKCNNKIAHDTITFENYYKDFLNNNLINYNIDCIRIQKFLLELL